MYDIALAVGRAMVELGLAKSEVPTTFTPEEIDKYFGGVRSALYPPPPPPPLLVLVLVLVLLWCRVMCGER